MLPPLLRLMLLLAFGEVTELTDLTDLDMPATPTVPVTTATILARGLRRPRLMLLLDMASGEVMAWDMPGTDTPTMLVTTATILGRDLRRQMLSQSSVSAMAIVAMDTEATDITDMVVVTTTDKHVVQPYQR